MEVIHFMEVVLYHQVTPRYNVVLPNFDTLNVPYQSIFQKEIVNKTVLMKSERTKCAKNAEVSTYKIALKTIK